MHNPPAPAAAATEASAPPAAAPPGGGVPHLQPSAFAAVAGDLEAAMASQIKRENVHLEAKRELTASAHGDLRRLEQERNVFLGQLERLRSAGVEEDADYAATVEKCAALRKELSALMGAEATAAGGQRERSARNAGAKGVLASLAASLAAAGGRADALEGELRVLREAVGAEVVGVAGLAVGSAQLEGVAGAHAAAAAGEEEVVRALKAAVGAAQQRTSALVLEKAALEDKLSALGVDMEGAKAKLQGAEKELLAAKARHIAA